VQQQLQSLEAKGVTNCIEDDPELLRQSVLAAVEFVTSFKAAALQVQP
jgi:hypothetical protein